MIDIGRVRFDVPDGLAWECTKCGKCCREQPADLNGEEIETIEEAGYKDFYIENGSPYPIIKRGKNGGCVFLTEGNLCGIYEIRPATCRIQPFGIRAYDFGEEKIIAYIPSFWIEACEGIHGGR